MASTDHGICTVLFFDTLVEVKAELRSMYPHAHVYEKEMGVHMLVHTFFTKGCMGGNTIPLDMQGTPFQKAVWKALLSIPRGTTVSYKELAKLLAKPKAYRAIGTAVGKNSIAIIIPCHRVITATGDRGNYRWGRVRKEMILAGELQNS